jgi:hypothetical protein
MTAGALRHRPAREILGLEFERVSPAAQLAMAITIAALWLLGRRYAGLVHDAILYTAIGLHRLEPAALAGDLFFAHGGQDAYTLFPAFYAPLIGALGPGAAALAVTVAGQVAFLAAAAGLVWQLARGPLRWWCLALLAVVSGYYGGVGVFRLAEPFATARTFAEPLVVAALACTLAARHRLALAALAAAFLLHPIVAVPGILAVLLWHALGAGAAWRVLLPSALVAAAILAAPWHWPGLRFDAEWLAAVQQRSPHLFVSRWLAPDWARFAWGFALAWLAAAHADARVRRLIAAVAVTVAGATVFSWLAADVLDHALATSLQLWRAHWLLHLLALVLVPVVVAGLWRGGSTARAAAACVAASVCFGRFELPAAAVLAFAGVALSWLAGRRAEAIGNRGLRIVVALAGCAAAAGLLFDLQERLPLEYAPHASAGWPALLHMVTALGGLLPVGVVLLLFAHSRRTGVALALSLAAFAFSVAAWDARTGWRRMLEQAHGQPNPFRAALRPASPVYWDAPGVPAWLLLSEPSWFSVDQGGGIIFSRATALEYARRERATRSLRAAMQDCSAAVSSGCLIPARAAGALCADPQGPRYVVFNAPIEEITGPAWTLPRDGFAGTQRWHLYACANVLRDSPARK